MERAQLTSLKEYSLTLSWGRVSWSIRPSWRPARAQGKFRTTGVCWTCVSRSTCCCCSCLGRWGGRRNTASQSCTVPRLSSYPWKRRGPREVGWGDSYMSYLHTGFQISAGPLTGPVTRSQLQASVSSSLKPREDIPPTQE